jgi:IMP dehydrogenase
MKLKEGLSYQDVLIVPQFSDIRSRKEVDLRSSLGSTVCSLPIISSPMDTVTEDRMALAMAKAGGVSVIHRYNSPEQQALIVRRVLESGLDIDATAHTAAAIGTSSDELARARTLVDAGIRILCVDVAHGHHVLMRNALRNLRKDFGDHIHIIAGNIATKDGYEALVDWGANSVRANIGSGSICSTKIQTGHGVPGLQTIFDCAESSYDAPIIADGGIRNSGDIVKALAAGANFVMCGSLLSGTDETPGDVLETSEGKFKAYRGMASKDAQIAWRGRAASLEGIATRVRLKGSVADVLGDLERGIRSGLSYSGARTIHELQDKAVFMRQTNAGQIESSTHIFNAEGERR